MCLEYGRRVKKDIHRSIPAFDDEEHARPEADFPLLGDQFVADPQGVPPPQNRFLERVTEAGEGHAFELNLQALWDEA